MKLLIQSSAVILLLVCFQGCASSGVKNGDSSLTGGKCIPVELFVPIPEGGEILSGVTINRDGNGHISTTWKTSLPAGTKSMMTLGLWKPEPKKDIPYGPSLDGAGMEKTSCDGKIITHTPKFSNDGAGFNQGQYFLQLTVIDNPVWKQPASTQSVLSSAKGKVKAVSADFIGGRLFGTKLEVTARFELPDCEGLQATLPKPPPTPLSKEGAEAIARSFLAKDMESKMAQQGLPVKITVSGQNNTIITIESINFTRETVTRQAGNAEYMAPFRKMRFKRVVFTNGTEEWGFNIK